MCSYQQLFWAVFLAGIGGVVLEMSRRAFFKWRHRRIVEQETQREQVRSLGRDVAEILKRVLVHRDLIAQIEDKLDAHLKGGH